MIDMRVMMTGGGTAGHINPALAIAETIKRNCPDAEIAFVGTPKGMENRLVTREGYKLYHVQIQGLRRSLSLSNLKTAYLTLTSVGKAKKILKDYKPDIVIGTGGYVCYPLCKAAAKCGIPVALHESNATPGMAVKLLMGDADIVFTNFEKVKELIKPKYRNKILRVGNPFRGTKDIYDREKARQELGITGKYKYSVLVFGGSLGALTVNNATTEAAQDWFSGRKDILLTHAAGAGNYEDVKAAYGEKNINSPNIELLDYIYNMPQRLAAADVVVCRSGAMTMSEIALYGKAAIFVPSPNVTDDQQYKNARVFADAGAGTVIKDAEFTKDTLVSAVEMLLSDDEKRLKTEQAARSFATPDANDVIYDNIIKLIHK